MSVPDELGYSLVELADQTGLSPRTIHYYSSQGLLPPADRRGAGARYPVSTLHRLRAVQAFKSEVRLTLQEIRRVLGPLPENRVSAIASGDISPWEVLDRPGAPTRSVPPLAASSRQSAAAAPRPPGRAPHSATESPSPAAMASSSSVAVSSDPARDSQGPTAGPVPRDVPVVGGEASAQLASLLRTLDSRAGRSIPRAGSRDHWLSIPITADLQISAHRVSGEDIEVLRRVADHLRALLVQGFADSRSTPTGSGVVMPPSTAAGEDHGSQESAGRRLEGGGGRGASVDSN